MAIQIIKSRIKELEQEIEKLERIRQSHSSSGLRLRYEFTLKTLHFNEWLIECII